MNEEAKEIVRSIIKRMGDDFWKEEGNEYLFDEIVEMLNQAGYDLWLVKKHKDKVCLSCAEGDLGRRIPDEMKPLVIRVAREFCRYAERYDVACTLCPVCFCFVDECDCEKECRIEEVEWYEVIG